MKTQCRSCGAPLAPMGVDFGQQYMTGTFPRPGEYVDQSPLILLECEHCRLVQLSESYSPVKLFHEGYGYRSSLNRSMVEHLRDVVADALSILPSPGVVLDIGANDGTTLNLVTKINAGDRAVLVSFDPVLKWLDDPHYPEHTIKRPEFFSAEAYFGAVDQKADLIFSLAMLYDLDDPDAFTRDVAKVLALDGLWVVEVAYWPSMMVNTVYDTICHEHLNHFCLNDLRRLAERAGLEVVWAQVNSVNGGSLLCFLKHRKSNSVVHPGVADIMDVEARVNTEYNRKMFARNIINHREMMVNYLESAHKHQHIVYGYGASTKGNVILQHCGIGPGLITAIGEVNADKFGCVTPGTNIPIISEQEMRCADPDVLVVFPWHFRAEIEQKEKGFTDGGGKLFFPLPMLSGIHEPALKFNP